MSIDYSSFAFPKPSKKEKNKIKIIKGKKHTQTRKKEISSKTKILVWERDKHKCIFCGKYVKWNNANAHLIKRSSGGLGIPENLFTSCEECHMEQDNGLNSIALTDYARNYLKNLYGKDWKESNLVYKKY